jgi:hypothetical protein
VLKERLGTLAWRPVAVADLEPPFRQAPAIHRFPGAMAERVHELAVFIMDGYGRRRGRACGPISHLPRPTGCAREHRRAARASAR